MSYLATGLTPEEESELLETSRAVRDYVDHQKSVRTLVIVSTIGGLLYTLAKIGEATAEFRRRRSGGGI